MALRTLSICTGVGGIELGLELAGLELDVVCYVEGEAYAAALLAEAVDAKLIPQAPVWSDVRSLCDAGFRDFMEGIKLDLLCGGYPCQPFSVAGKQRGADDERHLWPAIAEAVGAYRPKVCFFENVPAHLANGYPEVRADLRAMGYRVTEGLFSAGELGANHRRQRLFILAVGDGTDKHAGARCGKGEAENGQSPEGGRDRPADGSETVGDADGDGIQGQRADRKQEFSTQTGCNGTGFFPPGPGERERWREILGRSPELAPAVESGVRLLADGLPVVVDEHRNHQLRASGNAVVPLAAAYAWVFLWADMLYGMGGRQWLTTAR